MMWLASRRQQRPYDSGMPPAVRKGLTGCLYRTG